MRSTRAGTLSRAQPMVGLSTRIVRARQFIHTHLLLVRYYFSLTVIYANGQVSGNHTRPIIRAYAESPPREQEVLPRTRAQLTRAQLLKRHPF